MPASRNTFFSAIITVAILWSALRAQSSALPAVVSTPQPGILDVTTGELPATSPVAVEIRKGTIAPGSATIWHTHPTPVFIYVESGTGTWEYKNRQPTRRSAGQAVEEPANVVMRIVNSGTSRLDLVIFQVSKPGDPVLVPVPKSTQPGQHHDGGTDEKGGQRKV